MKGTENHPAPKIRAVCSRQPGDPRGTHGFASHPCGWFALVEEPDGVCTATVCPGQAPVAPPVGHADGRLALLATPLIDPTPKHGTPPCCCQPILSLVLRSAR